MKLNLKRKSDIWVSNNRVLVGNNKKITGRNPNFDLDETKLLIKLWGDPKIQRTLITSHKKYAVIVKLAEKMRSYGYQRSPEEINTRIKNLKCFYNRLKKDLEVGAITTPSWKHYSTMDEIMTRQIFSVRPNEIPKPSLSYRLEEESREREERRAHGEQTPTIIDNNNIHDELIDNDDVMVVTTPDITSENDEMELMNEDSPSKLKDEPNSIDEYEESIINIKEEPIDYDSIKGYDEISEDGMANVSDFLELSEADTPTPPKVASPVITTSKSRSKTSSITKSQTKTVTPSATETTCSSQKPVYFSNQKLVSQQNGKISLVPTSMLLQQPSTKTILQSVLQPVVRPQQIQIRSPQNQHQQHRILYTQPTTQANTGLVTTGPGGMKVLFVKANGSNPTELVQTTSKVHNGNIQTAALPSTNINNFLPSTSNIKINNARTTTLEDHLDKDEKDNHYQAIHALLSNLIQLQCDNNEIQRQRLELARERLVFEKSVAEKWIIASPHLFKGPKEDLEQKSSIKEPMTMIHTMEPVNKMQEPTEIIENENPESSTVPLLVPKTEKED